jgi:hypothetical protein
MWPDRDLSRNDTGKFPQWFHAVEPALEPPVFNPHLTKTRLNDAPHLCEMLPGNLARNIKEGLGGIVLGGV